MANKSREIHERENGMEGEIQTISPFQRLLSSMAARATLAQEEGFNGDDLSAILEAETEQEMWDADDRGPLNAKDLVNCELVINDVQVKYSRGGSVGGEEIKTVFTAPDGKQMYLMVSATRISDAGEKKTVRLPDVGTPFQFNTSARFVVAKLDWLARHGMIPGITVLVEGVDLGGGQTVVKLRPMSKRAVPAGN